MNIPKYMEWIHSKEIDGHPCDFIYNERGKVIWLHECSVCGAKALWNDSIEGDGKENKSNFCPSCGLPSKEYYEKHHPSYDVYIHREEAIKALSNVQYSVNFCKEHHIDRSVNMEMVRMILNNYIE